MARSAVGFVVEGHGEYNCYPSLFCRAVNAPGLNVPRINASGCGGVVKNLPEHLTDMCRLYAPNTIIVTVDLVDVIDQGLAQDCADLVRLLCSHIEDWRETAVTDARIETLPQVVTPVVQIRKFETWLLADVDGLKAAGLISQDVEIVNDAEAVNDPVTWIRKNVNIPGDVKSPRFAREVTSALRPDHMRNASRSFDKFYRECNAGYTCWVDSMDAQA